MASSSSQSLPQEIHWSAQIIDYKVILNQPAVIFVVSYTHCMEVK